MSVEMPAVDIETYVQSLDLLARNRSNFNFTATSPVNAAVTIALIFKYAQHEVKIYDHCLSGDIADQHPIFYNSLEKFFKAGKHLTIVLRGEQKFESDLYEKLGRFAEKYPTAIQVRSIESTFENNADDLTQKDVNFVVSDSYSYRVENIEHAENIDKEAICNFNDKWFANKLLRLFDRHYASSIDITPSLV